MMSLTQFTQAKKRVTATDKDYLALWHSMLTGNTRSLSKTFKVKYQDLGLAHIFTPSGFHLSSLLTPLRFLLPAKLMKPILIIISILIFQLPGQEALKRMGLIKVIQNQLGSKTGFYAAMIICLMMGQLNSSPLSYIFSLFFLGLIFSHLRGISLIIWFFIGQILITQLNGGNVSLLNLIFSPIANLLLTLITPLLFLLSYPLGEFQLRTGILIIKYFDHVINFFYQIISNGPQIEVHLFTLTLLTLVLWRMKTLFIMGVFLFSSTLNRELPSAIKASSSYFLPRGEMMKTIIKNGERYEYFEDGLCKVRLRMGIWEKRCSPKRAPRKIKSLKKLSYL